MAMTEFILGRECEEPFVIPKGATAVSRQHARIIIDDKKWTLEDLGSPNGTYVRGDDGKLVRVSRVSISPDTFIVLGGETVKGCSFYARHILSPSNFLDDFYYIRDKKNEFDERLKRQERKAKYIKWGTTGLSALALIGSMFFTDPAGTILFLRLSSLVTVITGLAYDPINARKSIKEQEALFMQCPNPSCHNILSANDVKNMHCPRCKAQ
ncbi:MAG: FHA domain-containing protein [Muribaculaceae bacterium]|nr:FHA domain-containing protein [Muribaculaceae bacterium]